MTGDGCQGSEGSERQRQVVIVAGSNRTGTSLLTEILIRDGFSPPAGEMVASEPYDVHESQEFKRISGFKGSLMLTQPGRPIRATFEMLEPSDRKLSRSVLRGPDGGNVVRPPDLLWSVCSLQEHRSCDLPQASPPDSDSKFNNRVRPTMHRAV